MTNETDQTVLPLERRNRIASLSNAIDDGKELFEKEIAAAKSRGLRREYLGGLCLEMITVGRGYNEAIEGLSEYTPVNLDSLKRVVHILGILPI